MKKLIAMAIFLVVGMVHLSFAQSTVYKSAITNNGIRQQVAMTLETVSDGGIVVHRGVDLAEDNTNPTFYNLSGLGSSGTDPNSGLPVYTIPGSGKFWEVSFNGSITQLTPGSSYIQNASAILLSAPNVKEIGVIGDFYSYVTGSNKPMKITLISDGNGGVNFKREEYQTITANSSFPKQQMIYNRSGLTATQNGEEITIQIPDNTYWFIPFPGGSSPQQFVAANLNCKCTCVSNPGGTCRRVIGVDGVLRCLPDGSCHEDCEGRSAIIAVGSGGSQIFLGGGILVHATTVSLIDENGTTIAPNPCDFAGALHNTGLDYIISRKNDIDMTSQATKYASLISIITDFFIQEIAATPPTGYNETSARAAITTLLNNQLNIISQLSSNYSIENIGQYVSSDVLGYINNINSKLGTDDNTSLFNNLTSVQIHALSPTQVNSIVKTSNEQITYIENNIASSSLSDNDKQLAYIYASVGRHSQSFWAHQHDTYAALCWGCVGQADAEGAVAGAIGGINASIDSGLILFGPEGAIVTTVGAAVGGALLGSAIDAVFQLL